MATDTEEGNTAEITIGLVFQARAKMAEKKVSRPEDSIVSEMIEQLPQEKIRDYEVPPSPFLWAG